MPSLLRIFPMLALLLIFACSSSSSTPVAEETVDELTESLDGAGPVDAVVFPEVHTKDMGNDFAMDFAGTDAGPDVPQLNCQPGEGCFLDECASNATCQSGWCVEHMGDGVCTQTCQDECPPGWTCQQVAGTAPDVVFVCVSEYAGLCKPCASNGDCGTVGKQDVCVDYGDEGSFCGGSCEDPETGGKKECPWGFVCLEALTVDGAKSWQCVNEAGACPCTEKSVSLGLSTPCTIENDFGLCAGHRICTDEGLSECDAATPAMEECNGLDDNCNGLVDEATCDDGIQCTLDSCDPETGCIHESLDNGECADSNPCTVADHCVAGECIGSPVLCDDANPCTDDSCTETGGCIFEPNNLPCDDGNACTLADHCAAALCAGTPIDCGCQEDADCAPLENDDLCDGTLYCNKSTLPWVCDVSPGSEVDCPEPEGVDAICLKAACDPQSGECSYVPDHEGFACNDLDACTIGETCAQGTCGGGQPLNCNDGNVCTDDSCNMVQGCVHQPNVAPCQDGSVCTVGDTCEAAACKPGKALQCNDDNVCTDDSCDPAVGCVHLPNAAPCTDDNPCTSGDHCAQGKCVAATMLDCDDDNPCTDDACSAELGCIHTHNQAPCDDGNECTTKDKCATGWCLGVLLSCDDGNLCTTDSCDPESGCINVPNNLLCNDGSVCTLGDQCQDGACKGEAVDCNDGNLCTDDSCNDALGCVHKLNQAPCDDGDVCTKEDHCQAGECAGGAPVLCDDQVECTVDQCLGPDGCTFVPNHGACDDANPCTDDACDTVNGCVHTLNQAPCDDGNPCTEGDLCNAGLCNGGPVADCDDDNVCTQDSCDAESGCNHAPVAGNCDDGNPCTTNDSCQLGECTGAPLPCDDGVPCTVDECTPQAGCLSTPNDDACDDGNVCTADTCDADAGCTYAPVQGQCEGGSCVDGECVPACVPDCAGKECGDDGCDGTCGSCQAGYNCMAGTCVEAGSEECDDGNDILWDGCTNGKISEFLVNSFTPGDQTYPDVTGLTNGRYVIIWNSYDQDGSQFGVYGQLYAADGSALGDELQVNTYTTSYQYLPKVAPLGDGRFIVAWQSPNQEGDNQYHIYTQRFHADGTPDGTETRMDTQNSSPHDHPAVGGLTDDSVLVAWRGHPDGSGYGVFHRAFDGNGNPLTGDTVTNTYLGSTQEYPDIIGHPGGHIVVWQSNGQDSSGWGVYGQRFNAAGGKIGEEIKVHTYTQGDQRYPRVAAYDDGGFVAVWESSYEDASGTGVYCQRFKPDATKIGNPFRVNTYIVSNQERPDLSAWSDGRFVVVWTSNAQDGENGGIFGQRYNANGTPAGKEFQVNSYTAYTQQYAAVSTIPGAGFVVAWNSQAQDGSVSGVFAQRYDASGNKLYH